MKARVLLSTYNGRATLEALFKSLEDQIGGHPHIVVRDDGSVDGTVELLRTYAEKGLLEYSVGRNIGARASYFELLFAASGDDIIFLADQDDIWHSDKIQRALRELSKFPNDVPALYCGRVEIVDDNLVSRGFSPLWPRPPSFENALVENIAMGCTIALNRRAAELLRSKGPPLSAVMHDWWCYLVIASLGTVIYDPEPVLRYRIHGNNFVGLSTTRLLGTIARIRRQWRASTISQCAKQAAELKHLFSQQLSTDQVELIDKLIATRTLTGRLLFVAQRRIRRQFYVDDILLKLLTAIRGTY